MIRQIRFRRPLLGTLILSGFALAAGPLSAQDTAPAAAPPAAQSPKALTVELNKLEPQGNGCRAYVVVQNDDDIAYKAFKLDLVLFQTDGIIGRRFAMQKGLSGDEARSVLIDTLWQWEAALALPRLGAYRVASADFSRVVANARGSSMKTNPVELTDAELAAILAERL